MILKQNQRYVEFLMRELLTCTTAEAVRCISTSYKKSPLAQNTEACVFKIEEPIKRLTSGSVCMFDPVVVICFLQHTESH